jgi:hypothetical protein
MSVATVSPGALAEFIKMGQRHSKWHDRKQGAGAGSGTFFGESILPIFSVSAENMYLTLLPEVLVPPRWCAACKFSTHFQNQVLRLTKVLV